MPAFVNRLIKVTGGAYGACGRISQDSEKVVALAIARVRSLPLSFHSGRTDTLFTQYGTGSNNAPDCGRQVSITNKANGPSSPVFCRATTDLSHRQDYHRDRARRLPRVRPLSSSRTPRADVPSSDVGPTTRSTSPGPPLPLSVTLTPESWRSSGTFCRHL